MATRTEQKIKETMMQFSKKMCTAVTLFWMLYRVAVSLLLYFRPSVANAMLHLTDGVDTVQIVNMGVYCTASGVEKVAVAFGKRNVYNVDSEKDEDEESKDEESEKEDNG